MEHLPLDYGVALEQKGQEVEVAFQGKQMTEIMASLNLVQDKLEHLNNTNREDNQMPCSTCGPHPNTQAADFNFDREG